MKIEYVGTSKQDLADIFDYIAQDSKKSASKVLKLIKSEIEKLKRFPEIGRPGRMEETREIVVSHSPFIIVYRYKKDTVEIISIFHTSRKWVDKF